MHGLDKFLTFSVCTLVYKLQIHAAACLHALHKSSYSRNASPIFTLPKFITFRWPLLFTLWNRGIYYCLFIPTISMTTMQNFAFFLLSATLLLSTLPFKHPSLLNTVHLLSCWLHCTAHCIFGILLPLLRWLLFCFSARLTSESVLSVWDVR